MKIFLTSIFFLYSLNLMAINWEVKGTHYSSKPKDCYGSFSFKKGPPPNKPKIKLDPQKESELMESKITLYQDGSILYRGKYFDKSINSAIGPICPGDCVRIFADQVGKVKYARVLYQRGLNFLDFSTSDVKIDTDFQVYLSDKSLRSDLDHYFWVGYSQIYRKEDPKLCAHIKHFKNTNEKLIQSE